MQREQPFFHRALSGGKRQHRPRNRRIPPADGTREEHPVTGEYRAENALRDFLNRFHVEGEYSDYCGLYGYTSFNAVRYFENIPVKDSREAPTMRRICYTYYTSISSFSTTSRTRCCCWKCWLPAGKASWTKYGKPFTPQLYRLRLPCRRRNDLSADGRGAQSQHPPRNSSLHAGDWFPGIVSPAASSNVSQATIQALSRSAAASTPLPTCFTLTSAVSVSSAHRPKPHCRIEGRHAYIDPIAGTTKRTGDPEPGCRKRPLPARRPERKRGARDAGRPRPQRPQPQLP